MFKLFKSLWAYFANEDLTMAAAALSYTTVLSIVPFLAVSLAALNYFNALESLTPRVESALLENFSDTAGTEGVQLMKKGIKRIQSGRLGSLGGIVLIFISTRLMFGLERAFHRIWQIKNKRPFAMRLLYYWLFLLLFPFAIALWVWVFKNVKPEAEQFILRPGYFVTFSLLFVLQKWLPSQKVKAVPALLGTGLSVLLLFALEKTFALVGAQFFSYGRVYGSFAAVPVFLVWVFMLWMIILWGVALTASLQNRQAS